MLLSMCVLVCNSLVGWAQIGRERPSGVGSRESSYYIEGRVVDDKGTPVRMARIVLAPFRAEVGQTSFSDDEGRFTFYDLRQGSYKVSASATGYTTETHMVDLFGGSQNIQIVLRRSDSASNSAPARAVPAAELAAPPKARERYQKGMRELERRKFEKSIEHLQAAIKEYPPYASAYSGLGIAHIQMRNRDLAREAFEKALGLDANSVEAHLGMGLVCNDEERYADAEKYLMKAQQLNPADWHVHYELGRTYYGLNQLERAEKNLRRAHEAHHDYGNLHLLLANVLVLQNNYAEGLAEMEEFLKIAPNTPLAPQVREKVKLLKAELARPLQ
ncbi:MAG: tetratricopeptide repeat protein [Acidobacteria bacterium]|nr:tetratricopeptide repeat protein [Acidobacteriota bacterium]